MIIYRACDNYLDKCNHFLSLFYPSKAKFIEFFKYNVLLLFLDSNKSRASATLRNDGSLEENSSAELLFQRKNRINVKKKIKRAG